MSQEISARSDLHEQITRLTLSPIAQRIRNATQDENTPGEYLADVLREDCTFTERLLLLISYTPGLDTPVADLRQAIVAMGVQNIKALALGLTILCAESHAGELNLHRGSNTEFSGTRQRLCEHSLACAILAAQMALHTNERFSRTAFTAGLLHDIGRVLLYDFSRNQFFAGLSMARDKQIPAAEAETLAVGWNHLEVGELWAQANGLDDRLYAAIRQHHVNFAIIEEFHGKHNEFVALIQAADSLCELCGLDRISFPEPIDNGLWSAVGLEADDWILQMKKTEAQIEGAAEVFGFGQRPTTAFGRPLMCQKRMEPENSLKRKSEARSHGGQVIPFPERISSETRRTKKLPQRLTILIVEDHGSLCDMLSLYFMRYGYHVRTAGDGENALAILENEDVHLVLLDLMLPRIDGFAVLQQIRERPPSKHPYVIVVSAGASTKDRSRVLELGANEYMPKPFHLMRLLERIQNVEKYLLS